MATNLWPNASLEWWITDWTLSNGGILAQSTTKAYDSSNSLRINSNSFDNYAGATSDTQDVDASTQYTFSVYVNPDVELSIACTVYDQADGWLQGGNTTCAANGWTRITRTFTTGEAATGVYVVISKNNTSSEEYWYVDGVMLETGASASAWVDYAGGPALVELVIADCTTDLSCDGASPPSDGLWDIGAYIYSSGTGIVLEVGDTIDALLVIANASLALSSENLDLVQAQVIAIQNASLALSSDSLDIDAGASIVVDANRIAKIIFVMKNG